MLKPNEELLHFIWQYKLLKPGPLITTSGKEVTILKPGTLNRDAGPDFFTSCININGVMLAGNIEIHCKTSDWLKHKHQQNKNYDTIILHAVYEHDIDILQNQQNNVEVLELKSYISKATLNKYNELLESKTTVPCSRQLDSVTGIKFISWLERMAIERLQTKVARISQLFESFNHDYSQTFYTLLLRNFGFKVNAVPFELLAGQLPLNLLLKHANDLMQLEALLLGTCGLLEDRFEHKYILALQNEYEYLKLKYRLLPLKKEIFKFSRMRPANFPTVRLAQLAILIHKSSQVFISPHLFIETENIKKQLLVKPEGYWKEHYKTTGKGSAKELAMGISSAENIIINTFAPFFFFYSQKTGRAEYADYAIKFLEQCGFENNTKTRLYSGRKEELKNAAGSQGLITLHDNYCVPKLCLKCGIAAAILNEVKMT